MVGRAEEFDASQASIVNAAILQERRMVRLEDAQTAILESTKRIEEHLAKLNGKVITQAAAIEANREKIASHIQEIKDRRVYERIDTVEHQANELQRVQYDEDAVKEHKSSRSRTLDSIRVTSFDIIKLLLGFVGAIETLRLLH